MTVEVINGNRAAVLKRRPSSRVAKAMAKKRIRRQIASGSAEVFVSPSRYSPRLFETHAKKVLSEISMIVHQELQPESLEREHLNDFFDELNYLFVDNQTLKAPGYRPVLTAHPSWARIRNYHLIALISNIINKSESLDDLKGKVRKAMNKDFKIKKPSIKHEMRLLDLRIKAAQRHYPGIVLDIWCDFDRGDMDDKKTWQAYLISLNKVVEGYANVNIQMRLPSEKLDVERVKEAIKNERITALVIANFTKDTTGFESSSDEFISQSFKEAEGFELADVLGEYIEQERNKLGFSKLTLFPLLEDPESMKNYFFYVKNKLNDLKEKTEFGFDDIAKIKESLSFLIMHACSDMGPYGLYGQCLTLFLDALGAGADFMGEGNSALRQVFFSLKHVVMKTIQGTYGNEAFRELKDIEKDQVSRNADFKLIGELCGIDGLNSEADAETMNIQDWQRIIETLVSEAKKSKRIFDRISQKFEQEGLSYKAGSRGASVATVKNAQTLKDARAIGKVWGASQLNLTALWMIIHKKHQPAVLKWIETIDEGRLIALFERLKGPHLMFAHLKERFKVDDKFLKQTFPEHFEIYKKTQSVFEGVKEALVKVSNQADKDLMTMTPLEVEVMNRGLSYLSKKADSHLKNNFNKIMPVSKLSRKRPPFKTDFAIPGNLSSDRSSDKKQKLG